MMQSFNSRNLLNLGINSAAKSFVFAFGLIKICTAAPSDCNTSFSQLQGTQFKSSVVVNGEVAREENGKPLEPFQSIAKPTQIGFIPGNSKYVFFNEIYRGNIKKWDMESKTMATILHMDLVTTGERGLTGFVFHPNFAVNHWVFVVYNVINKNVKLARYEYDLATDKLINPKILIDHDLKTDLHHYGNGQLTIDDNGTLFMGIGSDAWYAGDELFWDNLNQNAEATGGNTNTISSGFIRIIPDSSVKGYKIPAGNFGEFFEKYFRALGNNAVADEYKTKVLPEIYVKGIRTCYTATVHPKKGWLAWGEVNTSTFWDEYDVIKNPMFSGYPYFHGNNDPLKGASPNQNADVTKPIPNKSKYNTGASMLPPPQPQSLPPLNTGKATASVVGAIYNFDSYSGVNRFPKAFDQNLLMFDFEWQETHMFVSKLEDNGNFVKAGPQINVSNLLGGVFMKSTLDAEFSPAGELYLLNVGDNTYGTCGNQCGSIDKVSYTGNQCPQSVSLKVEQPKFNMRRMGNAIQSNLVSPIQINLYSIKGTLLVSKILAPNHSLNLKSELSERGIHSSAGSLYLLTLVSEGKSQTEKFVLGQ